VTADLSFTPHRLVRNRHVQTIVSSRTRVRGAGMSRSGQNMLLEVEAGGETVRMTGVYSPHPPETRRGLVLLLHGWLGNINATYLLGEGEFLYKQGYSIFRLNMRDHGGTAALNAGLFHGGLIEEVFQAARQAAALEPDSPFYVIGFSMGGNFALRVAWRHACEPIPNLKSAIAISPSADPARVTEALDRHWVYLAYFRRKWRKNLVEKQMAFPHLYDFSHLLEQNTCTAMTGVFVNEFSPYPDTAAYFESYGFTPDKLRPVNIPITILTAVDDPIIPVESFSVYEGINPNLTLHITRYGGHVGYIDLFPFRTWLNQATLTLLGDRVTG